MNEESSTAELKWRVERFGDTDFHEGCEAHRNYYRTRYLIGPWGTGFYASYSGIDDSLEQDTNGSYIGLRHATLEIAKTACERHRDKIRQNSTFSTCNEWRVRLVRGLFCSCGYELQASNVRRDDSGTRLTCMQCRRDILIMD